MVGDNKGQVSLEYLLISAISLIIIIAFTLPMAELTIQDTLDVSNTLDVKSDLSKISQAIESVYGQGQGSRQSVNIVSHSPSRIEITDSHISCSMRLNDGTRKNVEVDATSNLGKTTIPVSKGENTITVEWPVGSERMNIYKSG